MPTPLPPTIDAIVKAHSDTEDFDIVGFTLLVTHEACRLQRKHDLAFLESEPDGGRHAFFLKDIPLVVEGTL